MASRKQLQDLARLRMREAETLFETGLYDGAAYLCGYVVESALEARICKLLAVGVSRWTPELRYANPGAVSREQAREMLDAIRDPEKGVFTWLKRRW